MWKALICILATAFAFASITSAQLRPSTLENNDSCDISVTPAATLLLPYFEVDVDDPSGETTLFTITNVTSIVQIARVTLWTDHAYPVVTFNLYLTGYDVQSINLYDVIANGVIGSLPGTGAWISHEGDHSDSNIHLDPSQCDVLNAQMSSSTRARIQQAFLEGRINGVCNFLGSAHRNAVGYATIDVVGNCGTDGPTEPRYFTEDIRFDNVLIGDYQQIDPGYNFGRGNPMVHIRAIPDGGSARMRAGQSQYDPPFDRTFYGHLQNAANPRADARQPLPSTFALHWINGGSGGFETSLKIWRQGVHSADADCEAYKSAWATVAESIVFDENENGEGSPPQPCPFLCVGSNEIALPNTALVGMEHSDTFPQDIFGNIQSGWLYLNLDDVPVGYPYLPAPLPGGHQAWVVVSMRAGGLYSADMDASWLGNGCSAPMPATSYSNVRLPPINHPGAQHPAAILPGPASDGNAPVP